MRDYVRLVIRDDARLCATPSTANFSLHKCALVFASLRLGMPYVLNLLLYRHAQIVDSVYRMVDS